MTDELTQIITNFILITKNQNTFLKNYTLFLLFNILLFLVDPLHYTP